jgi:hypothetical protein
LDFGFVVNANVDGSSESSIIVVIGVVVGVVTAELVAETNTVAGTKAVLQNPLLNI